MIVRLTPGFLPKAFGTGMTKGCGDDKGKEGMTKGCGDDKGKEGMTKGKEGMTLCINYFMKKEFYYFK